MVKIIILENMISDSEKKLHSKPVLECVSGTDSLHSNKAVWICWENVLKIQHLPMNSTAMVGVLLKNIWMLQCRDACWCWNVSKIQIFM